MTEKKKASNDTWQDAQGNYWTDLSGYDESGTKYTLKQHAVTNPMSLIYEHGAGWQVL